MSVVPEAPHVAQVEAVRKVAEFAARLAQAETVIASIKALHGKSGYSCRSCGGTWPCSTIRVIEAMK